MSAREPRKCRLATLGVALAAAAVAVAAVPASAADDVYVDQGVVVRPLSPWKQRQLERKLKRPGNQVVIEGAPAAVLPAPGPGSSSVVRSRRAFRPLFGDRFARRPEVVVAPPIVVGSATTVVTPGRPATAASRPALGPVIISTPRGVSAPEDGEVLPGSVDVPVRVPTNRAPIISTPSRPSPSATPSEPLDEPDLRDAAPATVRVLPPTEVIPPPVVSRPLRSESKPGRTDQPVPAPAPVAPAAPTTPPSPEPAAVDPGPDPGVVPPPVPTAVPDPAATSAPAPTPAATPSGEPPLEPPAAPRPA